MTTVLDAINLARSTYPDLTVAAARAILTDVFREALLQVPWLRTDTITVSLTAGTREYVLPVEVVAILQAGYQRTAGDTGSVMAVLRDQAVSAINPFWADGVQQGQPHTVVFGREPGSTSTTSLSLALDPIPNVTTASGYPRIRLKVSSMYRTPLQDADILPNVTGIEVYVEGIRARHTRNAYPEVFPAHDQRYKQLLHDLQVAVKRESGSPGIDITPGFARQRPGLI